MFRWGKGLGYLVVVDVCRFLLGSLWEVGTVRFEQTERLPAGHDGAVAGLRAYACAPRDR